MAVDVTGIKDLNRVKSVAQTYKRVLTNRINDMQMNTSGAVKGSTIEAYFKTYTNEIKNEMKGYLNILDSLITSIDNVKANYHKTELAGSSPLLNAANKLKS